MRRQRWMRRQLLVRTWRYRRIKQQRSGMTLVRHARKACTCLPSPQNPGDSMRRAAEWTTTGCANTTLPAIPARLRCSAECPAASLHMRRLQQR